MNFADYIILFIILIALTASLIFIYKRKKAGKCIGCSGDCSSCGKVHDFSKTGK